MCGGRDRGGIALKKAADDTGTCRRRSIIHAEEEGKAPFIFDRQKNLPRAPIHVEHVTNEVTRTTAQSLVALLRDRMRSTRNLLLLKAKAKPSLQEGGGALARRPTAQRPPASHGAP